jgi:hypothetical protein
MVGDLSRATWGVVCVARHAIQGFSCLTDQYFQHSVEGTASCTMIMKLYLQFILSHTEGDAVRNPFRLLCLCICFLSAMCPRSSHQNEPLETRIYTRRPSLSSITIRGPHQSRWLGGPTERHRTGDIHRFLTDKVGSLLDHEDVATM